MGRRPAPAGTERGWADELMVVASIERRMSASVLPPAIDAGPPAAHSQATEPRLTRSAPGELADNKPEAVPAR